MVLTVPLLSQFQHLKMYLRQKIIQDYYDVVFFIKKGENFVNVENIFKMANHDEMTLWDLIVFCVNIN